MFIFIIQKIAAPSDSSFLQLQKATAPSDSSFFESKIFTAPFDSSFLRSKKTCCTFVHFIFATQKNRYTFVYYIYTVLKIRVPPYCPFLVLKKQFLHCIEKSAAKIINIFQTRIIILKKFRKRHYFYFFNLDILCME